MSNESSNRLKIVNNENGAPAQHTAAQRAARRNGARSGPITEEGTARSRRNALKQGVLAKHFAPPSDMRGHDRLFNCIRDELIKEFRPKTFIQFAQIGSMAQDYVNLARARKMMEILQRPTPLQPDDAEKWEKVQDAKKDIRLLKRVIAQANSLDNFACSQKDAARCAQIVRGLGEHVMQDLAEAQQEMDEAAEEIGKDGPDESDTLDPEDDEQQAERVLWIKMNEDGRPWYEDMIDVAAILRGNKPTARDFRTNLAEILAYPVKRLQQIVKFHSSVLRKADKLCDATLLALAEFPQKLIVLERYERQIEQTIERKERALRRQRR